MNRQCSPLVRVVCHCLLVCAVLVGGTRLASAQVSVTLPDTSQTTTLTATVAEQARVTVPAGVSFAVADVAVATDAAAASVSLSNIVLATASRQLRVSLQADAATFAPPVGGAATWAASDVTWNAAAWTNASGSSGTLTNAAYSTVATCNADVQSCSTNALVFTLAPNPDVKRSGNHTLVVRWKFEAI